MRADDTDAEAARFDPSAPPPAPPAIRSAYAIGFFLIATAAGTAGDLLSKHYVFARLLGDEQLQQRVEAVREAFRSQRGRDLTGAEALQQFSRPVGLGVKFRLSTNPGAVFGLPVPRWLTGLATVATVAVLLYLFAVSRASALPGHLGIAMIASGALGNLYDRLFAAVDTPVGQVIRHQVRDFIDCSALHYPWVFNVADALLVVGVAIMAGRAILRPHRPAKAEA